MTDLTRLQEALYKADVETIVRDLKYLGRTDEVRAAMAAADAIREKEGRAGDLEAAEWESARQMNALHSRIANQMATIRQLQAAQGDAK